MEELNDDINDDIYINSIFDFFQKKMMKLKILKMKIPNI